MYKDYSVSRHQNFSFLFCNMLNVKNINRVHTLSTNIRVITKFV